MKQTIVIISMEEFLQVARLLIKSRPISVGSVACNSTWIPSSSLLNLSSELAYNILLLIFDISGHLHNKFSTPHPPPKKKKLIIKQKNTETRTEKLDPFMYLTHCLLGKCKRSLRVGKPCKIDNYYYQAMKKILLFWQFSSVTKSKS